jgi:tetratricopeptide (TPR) repeat protein
VLIERLGSGGMGTVYRAYDRELGQEVALKVLHSFTAEDRLRLKLEFRALANIVHPNLVDLYELVADETSCFFTMELVSGRNFVDYTRSVLADQGRAAEFVERLTGAGRQLALALDALHSGGKLHRDVKPLNVLVTDAGRVVLLDFGLMTSLRSPDEVESEKLAGTLQYMSPEQAWGQPLSPAADWYSFGVTLFEAITGTVPPSKVFETTAQRRAEAPSLRERCPELPFELEELIGRLLDATPSARPQLAEVLECLGGDRRTPVRSVPPPERISDVFVGRETELLRLHEALDATVRGVPRVLHISGTSGIGKTSLMRSFLAQVQGSGRAVALCSRCYPQESVTFNAIDGLVDELSRDLERRRPPGLRDVAPQRALALLRVFPALAGVLAQADVTPEPGTSARLVRLRAFEGLGELLQCFARDKPLVIWADDVQWADHDSGILLQHLLRSIPDLRLLLVLSYRAEDGSTSACLRVLEESGLHEAATERIGLGPLSTGEGRRVVELLLERAFTNDPSKLDRLIDETGGSPFVINELARHLSTMDSGRPLPESIGLDEMLALRTGSLPESAREVLEIFSVAGHPLEQRVALRAARLSDADHPLIVKLERLSVLRTTDVPQRTSEIYHHRIRDEILRGMAPNVRAERHGAIARALLQRTGPTSLAAVDHFEAAGDLASVTRFVIPAATHASKLLAFDRAAGLYRRALELGASEMEKHDIEHRLAVALSNAGRGKEAGLAFLAAAETLRRQEESPERIEHLQQRAAEQFIQTGHYGEGMATIYSALDRLEIPFPRTRAEALRKSVGLRLWSTLRGVRVPKTRSHPPSSLELRRFDALFSMNIRLAMVDYAFASYATVRCSLDAIELGESSRAICALALEAAYSATIPGAPFQRRVDKLFGIADQLAQGTTRSYDRAFLLGSKGVAAWFRCEFDRTFANMDAATRELRSDTHGRQWEYGLWQAWALIGLAYLGNLRELVRRAESMRDEANQLDDRFTLEHANLGRPTTTWLIQDRPDDAIAHADEALGWAPSDYTTQHCQHYISTAEADLYRGDAPSAWQRSIDTWPSHDKNHYLMVTMVRDELLHAKARAALAAAEATRRGGKIAKADARSLRKSAEAIARTLASHKLPAATAWAELVRATLAYQEKNEQLARARLERAYSLFDGAKMRLYAEATRSRLGRLLGGDEGAAMTSVSERWLLSEGVENPRAMLRMLTPGFDE